MDANLLYFSLFTKESFNKMLHTPKDELYKKIKKSDILISDSKGTHRLVGLFYDKNKMDAPQLSLICMKSEILLAKQIAFELGKKIVYDGKLSAELFSEYSVGEVVGDSLWQQIDFLYALFVTFKEENEADKLLFELYKENCKKIVKVCKEVEVYIESLKKSFFYTMTNDLNSINRKLKSLGYNKIKKDDFSPNQHLAPEVQVKMIEHRATYSLLITDEIKVLNCYVCGKTPGIVYLDDFKNPCEKYDFNNLGNDKNFALEELKSKDKKTYSLIRAIRKNNPERVKKMIKLGANINYHDKDGFVYPAFFARKKNKEILKILIDAGVDLKYRSPATKFTVLNMLDDFCNLSFEETEKYCESLSNKRIADELKELGIDENGFNYFSEGLKDSISNTDKIKMVKDAGAIEIF